MPIDDLLPLTAVDAGNGWQGNAYKIYELKDYLDFRVMFDTTVLSVMRLQSNRDVHFYGELIVRDGGVRSFNTFGLTCFDSGQDVVSFRSGTGEGEEVLRVENDGTLSSAPEHGLSLRSRVLATAPILTAFTLNSDVAMYSTQTYLELQQAGSTAMTLTGAISGTAQIRAWNTGGLRITAEATGSAYKDLTLEADKLRLSTNGASGIEQWAKLQIVSNVRVLGIEDAGATAKVLEIQAEVLRFKDTGASVIWGEFYVDTKSYIVSTNDVYLKALSGATSKTIEIEGAGLKFLAKNASSKLVVTDTDASTERCALVNTAKLTLTAASSVEPSLELDATATTSGKKWTIRSGTAGGGLGHLLFVDTTDSITVEIDTEGSITTPKYIIFGTPITAAPSGGVVGAMILDDRASPKLWVKTSAGWKGAALI